MPTKLKIKQIYPEPISTSEVENNYVDLNTVQVITEEKHFQKSFTLTRDTSTFNWQDIVKFNGEPVEGDYNRVGSIRFSTNLTTQAHTVALNAITKGESDTNATFGTISVSILPDKTVSTYAPTPATSDNSTQIATTAYVKSNLSSYLPLAGGTTTGSIKCVAKNLGSTYVNAAKDTGAIISMTNTDSFGAWLSGYTKSYKVALATYPGTNEEVQLYSITKDNVTAGTNTANKFLRWNASTGALIADSFSGALTGNVTGNCSGTAANVTGTVAIANGGTGATTRLNACKALTNENVGSSPNYFITMTSSWGKFGYTSIADAKTALGLKSAAYTESSAYATSGHTHSYLPLSGGTLTGALSTNSDINLTDGKIMVTTNSTVAEHTTSIIQATTGTNDSWRIASGATAANAGFMEIATADDGTEPIYVRQYSGTYTTLKRTATILDASGNTSFPGTVTAPTFSGSLSGTASYAYNIAAQKISSLTKGTKPSSTVWTSSWLKCDSAGTATANRLGELRSFVDSSGTTGYEMLSYDYTSGATSAGTLGIYKPLGGTAYTAAPTPATSDNSTKIATTAYVKAQGYITSSGSITGNASTATEFSASKSVTLTGAITGTASSKAGWSVATSRKSCNVGQSGSSTTNPWYKVATVDLSSTANYDASIDLLVEDTYSSHKYGILKAHIRTDGDKKVATTATELTWLTHTGFTLADFVLVCPTTAGPTCELWTKIATGYMYRKFTVLSEGNRSTFSNSLWTLLNASSAGQAASITTSGTQIVSTNANVANNAANVTGTVAIANGGTGATTRLNAAKALTNENVGSSPNYFITMTTSWGKFGYTSVADAKTALGLKSAAYTESSAYATSGHTHSYLPLSGGTLTNSFYIQSSGITRGTAPSANKFMTWGCKDSAGAYIGAFEAGYYTNKSSKVAMYAYNTTAATGNNIGSLGIGCDTSGNVYTWGPTPAATDNSTKLATTAFVNSRLPYEVGTWTPTMSGSTTAGAFTYSYTGSGKRCFYVKFGKLIFLRAAFMYTITTAPAGEVRINGAPYVSNSYFSALAGGNTRRWDTTQIGYNKSYLIARIRKVDGTSAQTTINWGSSDTNTTWSNAVNSTDWIIFSIWYETS